ncbi:MAG TPA: hypothetical protein VFI95_08405 [Terriglobales bacterium]|nr:hypothetical protein [Terriglobales bacterium]
MHHTRSARNLFLLSLVVAISSSIWAQNLDRKVNRGIPGYLDPLTGRFSTLPAVDDSTDATAALTTVGGTLVFKFTITVKSAIPSTDNIACAAGAEVADSNGTFYSETAEVAATRGTGTATCTVTIPYSWQLATATTDRVTMTYSISAPGTFTSTNALPARQNSHSLASVAVPINGATTTVTVTATI